MFLCHFPGAIFPLQISAVPFFPLPCYRVNFFCTIVIRVNFTQYCMVDMALITGVVRQVSGFIIVSVSAYAACRVSHSIVIRII